MAVSPILLGYRFGPFTLEIRSGALLRNGRRVHLQEKPSSLLMALAEHPGELITRTELRERLWPHDTFVDFEDGLNTAMRKLRESLGDDPVCPRYIETMRGRGYRLIVDVAPVTTENAPNVTLETIANRIPAVLASSLVQSNEASASTGARVLRRAQRGSLAVPFLLGCAVAVATGALWYWLSHARPVLSFGTRDPIVIADFENQTGDPHFDRALGTALTVSLQQSRIITVYSPLRTQAALRLMKRSSNQPITAAVGREICQRENLHGMLVPGITRVGSEYRVTAELIDPETGDVVRSYAEPARNQDHILEALDAISESIRHDLGESRYEIHKNHNPLPKVTTPSMQALEDYAQATDFFGHARIDDANRMYHAAIAADPGFAMAWAGLAYMDYSFYVNRPDQGEKEFRTALSLDGRTTDREHAWIEARYAESQGRIHDALQLYRLFLERYPGDWAAEYFYARLLRMHGHADEAVPMYRDLIRQEPNDADNWIELATAYKGLEQWPSALQAYDKAFAIDPARMLTDETNLEYGFTLIQAGNDAKAGQLFSALLGNPETYPYGERELALLDIYHGQFGSARDRMLLALDKTQEPFSVSRIRFWLAAIADGQGNHREEIKQLDRAAAELDSVGPKVQYGAILGQAYARAGEAGKARAILNKIAPIANGRVEEEASYLALLKAEVEEAEGHPNMALRFLMPPSADDRPAVVQVTQEALAHLYQEMGNRDAAIMWYGKFANHGAPGWEPMRYWPEAEYMLADDYLQKRDRANAIRWASELLNHWQNADSDLPLLRKALLLRDRVIAPH